MEGSTPAAGGGGPARRSSPPGPWSGNGPSLPAYAPGYNQGIVDREFRRIWKERGVGGLLREIALALGRASAGALVRRVEAPTFRWNGLDLPYDSIGSALFTRASAEPIGHRLANVLSKLNSERAIEVPIAKAFVRPFLGSRILEVGNVMSSYLRLPDGWEVIDRYELARGVRNDDIAAVTPTPEYSAVLSVSTLEHVGWDEPQRDPARFRRALENCLGFLAPGGQALFTVPLRYNPGVDDWARQPPPRGFDYHCFARAGAWGAWEEVTAETAWQRGGAILVANYRSP